MRIDFFDGYQHNIDGGDSGMSDINLYRDIVFEDTGAPLEIKETTLQTSGFDILCHWHKHVQIYQILSGSAFVYCNNEPLRADAGDIALININELHYLESLSGTLRYRIVKIDFSCLLGDDLDRCRSMYVEPMLQQRLQFENRIVQDDALCRLLDRLADEFAGKRDGYELAVKGCLYDLLAVLVRSHMRKTACARDAERSLRRDRQFRAIIEFIEENYSEKITLAALAAMAHMSPEQFCRNFKRLTGRTAMDYINRLRVEKAHALLLQGGCNVSEAALSTGFADTNYFSRIYKKYKRFAPSSVM